MDNEFNGIGTPDAPKEPYKPELDDENMNEGEEYVEFDDISPEEVLTEICSADSDSEYWHSASTIIAELRMVRESELDGEDNEEKEEAEEIGRLIEDTTIERHRLFITTFDGDHISVTLEFDSVGDNKLAELTEICTKYQDAYGQLLEKDDSEADDDIEIPSFSMLATPDNYPGRYIVAFTDPVSMFRTCNNEGEPTCISFVFHQEDITVRTIDYTREEYNRLRDTAIRLEEAKAAYDI